MQQQQHHGLKRWLLEHHDTSADEVAVAVPAESDLTLEDDEPNQHLGIAESDSDVADALADGSRDDEGQDGTNWADCTPDQSWGSISKPEMDSSGSGSRNLNERKHYPRRNRRPPDSF